MRHHSILFLNRVYPPADGATGQLLAELAGELALAGWEVTVVTSRVAGAAASETLTGVRVERVGGLPFTRAGHWRRALSYLSLYPALFWRAWRLPRTEVIVTMTDPPLLALLGPLLKWRKGSRLLHWAQDVYPELAEEMGVLPKDGCAARLLRRLSTWALRHGDGIVAVGRCMKARLVERGLSPESVTVIPNWGLGSGGDRQMGDPETFRREHGLEGKFVVMYSGNFGLAHPFESILSAAEQLQSALPQAVFVFIGDGPRLGWVRGQAKQRGLRNVCFLPFQPAESLRQSLAAADLHLATMRAELCGLVVPSKVYGALAAGRPCVFLGPEDSEAAQLILQHGCGSVLAKATGTRLASCITQWAADPERRREAGQRAEALSNQLGLAAAAAAFEDVLQQVAERNLPAARAAGARGQSRLPSAISSTAT